MALALVRLLGVTLLLLSPAFVAAQEDYPNRPITMVVTFAPGGSSDVLAPARLRFDRLHGQCTVVS